MVLWALLKERCATHASSVYTSRLDVNMILKNILSSNVLEAQLALISALNNLENPTETYVAARRKEAQRWHGARKLKRLGATKFQPRQSAGSGKSKLIGNPKPECKPSARAKWDETEDETLNSIYPITSDGSSMTIPGIVHPCDYSFANGQKVQFKI